MPKSPTPLSLVPIADPSTVRMADFPASFASGDSASQNPSTDEDDAGLPDDPDLDDDNEDEDSDDEIAPDTPDENPDTSEPEIDLPLHDLQEH